MCGGSWIATATPRASGGVLRKNSRETSMRRASLGRQARSDSLHAGRIRYLSVDRSQEPGVASSRNHWFLRYRQPSRKFPLERIFGRPDRVLCLRRLIWSGPIKVRADHALNLGLLFFADVPYAIDLCAMVWFSSRDYGRGVNARPVEQQSRSSRDENNGCNRIVRFCSQDG